MEKIIQKALSLAGFQNADEITRVISATPNPTVAAEIILGVYKPMIIRQSDRFKKYRYDEQLAEITSVDELNNIINFNVYKQKTKTVYYLTKEDRENKKFVEVRPKDYYDSGRVPTNGYDVFVETVEIPEFHDRYNKQLTVDEGFQILKDWEEYGLPPVPEEQLNVLPF